MATPPSIIGSGKPHTVSLPDGSNVATHKTTQKRDPQAQELLTARGMAKSRAAPAESKTAPKPSRAAARNPRKQVAPEPEPEVPQPPPSLLGDAIIERIAQLRQANNAVRAALDRLPAAAR